ncbi:MAG: DHH family phosphoesterase [Candidatus Gribaldobacteria bacterium]|nr:DHH family phosphoesterase [Candidatus Gribaldobacteria bacterium]
MDKTSEIEKTKPIFITTGVHPDLDGLACCVGYSELQQKLGIKTVIGLVGGFDLETKFVLDYFDLALGDFNANPEDFDQVILVDTSEQRSLDERIRLDKVVEIIDHRLLNDSQLFPQAKVQIEALGAAATLIAEKFQQSQKGISQTAVILLQTAIISNTLNFKAHITSQHDRAMFNWLSQYFTLPTDFAWQMFMAKLDFSGSKLTEALEHDFRSGGLGKIGIAQIEMIGGAKLVDERLEEILDKLNQKQKELSLDYIFLSIIELKEGHNILVTSDRLTQNLLENVFKTNFKNNVAILSDLLMRKEIRPLLKATLEGTSWSSRLASK